MDSRTLLLLGLVGCGGAPFASSPEALATTDGSAAEADPPDSPASHPDSPSALPPPDAEPSETGSIIKDAVATVDADRPREAEAGPLPNCTLPYGTTAIASRSDFGTTPAGVLNGNSWTPGATSSWVELQFPVPTSILGVDLQMDSNGPDPQSEDIRVVADGVTVTDRVVSLNGSVSGGPASFGPVTLAASALSVRQLELVFTGNYNINVLSITLRTGFCS